VEWVAGWARNTYASVGGLSVHLPKGIELRGVNEQNLHLVEQLLARL